MRSTLLAYLGSNLTGTISVSTEQPWEEGGNPLYLKNMKRIYLAEPDSEQEELIPVLNASGINQTVTTVRGFLAVDAKNRSSDLDSALTVCAQAQANIDSFRKEFDYTSSLEDDVLLYELEYRFYNI